MTSRDHSTEYLVTEKSCGQALVGMVGAGGKSQWLGAEDS